MRHMSSEGLTNTAEFVRINAMSAAPTNWRKYALKLVGVGIGTAVAGPLDRKSTRLNSSHLVISYAVFCLKKKETIPSTLTPATVRLQSTRHSDHIDIT